MTEPRTSWKDSLPPKLRRRWIENCAKGGRNGRGEVKARAARIGWQMKPHRRTGPKPKPLGPFPTGFFCECGDWIEYPAQMNHLERQVHTHSCGRQHAIFKGMATLRKRRVEA